MKNKKKIAILALLAASLLLTGCRKTKPSASKCYGQCTAGAVVTTIR